MPRPASDLLRRWAQLVFGFLGWGAAVAFMVRSGLGVGPWDALHQGLHRQLGIGIGTASIGVGVLVVLGSLPFGIRPGAATIANMVLIGGFTDLLLPLLPPAQGWGWGLVYHLLGIVLSGWFTGVYIAAGLGKGPRDGLTMGLAARLDWPVRRIRTLIELSVLGLGWALGGTLGVGTLLFAVLIGPSMQWGLRRWDVLPTAPGSPTDATLPNAA
ncbi:MAG: YczE/YyaS/YitT family protein [Gemmatirosa sp.]